MEDVRRAGVVLKDAGGDEVDKRLIKGTPIIVCEALCPAITPIVYDVPLNGSFSNVAACLRFSAFRPKAAAFFLAMDIDLRRAACFRSLSCELIKVPVSISVSSHEGVELADTKSATDSWLLRSDSSF